VELFILDARSYRSENKDEDSAEKTMLGKTQLQWLKAGLAASDATWKIISNDVPLSVPTGSRADEYGRDAFASGDMKSGFENELLDLVRSMDAENVLNVVFIATDVHSAAQLRYERDYDGDGDTLLFHELIAGPLSAIRGPTPVTLDPTLGPVMLYGEGGIFNYGTVRISAGNAARLRADIRDELGNVRPGSELTLEPQ
jgi:alkaline phosphatase D